MLDTRQERLDESQYLVIRIQDIVHRQCIQDIVQNGKKQVQKAPCSDHFLRRKIARCPEYGHLVEEIQDAIIESCTDDQAQLAGVLLDLPYDPEDE